MISKLKQALYYQAISRYGMDSQYLQLAEEFGELLSALHKFKKMKIDREDVLSEIADAKIMLEQMIFMIGFTEEELENMEAAKLQKLKAYLDAH